MRARRDPGRRLGHRVVARRPDHRAAIGSSAWSRLESLEQDAFTEADERLLSDARRRAWASPSRTRACSTRRKRLLTETNERAAELALINDVQRGLAEKLDMQAMYDLVGDRIQAIFDAQVVDIGIVDREHGPGPLPVHDRARRALPGRADAARRASAGRSSRPASRS